MPSTDPLVLGLVLLAIGAALILLTLVFLRLFQRSRKEAPAGLGSAISLELPPHAEATLLVGPGGHIAFINQTARDWFGIPQGNPNLEQMGRRARPLENFLNLCAAEGKLSFSLDGRPIDGTSYQVPDGDGHALLVTLHRPKLSYGPEGGEEIAPEARGALEPLIELGQKISASLDLDTTLLAILENIERLVPADDLVISLSRPEAASLVPYRLAGSPGEAHRLEKGQRPASSEAGFTAWLAANRRSLLLADLSKGGSGIQPAGEANYPYQSYLGVPLLASQEFVGALELASRSPGAFSQKELDVLELLSVQAAVALRNALLYEGEGRRVQELAGLAQLAQVVSSLTEPTELYAHLIKSITPLMDVKIIGFLIFDERRSILEGQLPFMGLHPDVVEWTRAPIPPGSEAEKIWQSQEMIVAKDSPADPGLKALGLDKLAVAAGIRQTVLVPLTSGGRKLGYLTVADKRDGSAFEPSDLRLLAILAAQAAPIIENAALVQLSNRRALRAETLRRIASLTGSSATLDEVLRFSLQDLARLVQADKAAIFLLDESRGDLRLHKDSLFGLTADLGVRLGRLPTDDPQYQHTITSRQQPFVSEDASQETAILPVYRQLVNTLEVRSIIIVPLIVRDHSIGELILGKDKPYFFNSGDVQSVLTAAGQLAGATEQAKLYSQTDDSLRRRVEQLTSITRISHELNSTHDLNHLLQRIYEELLHTTQADCGTIILFDLNQNHPQVEAGSLPKVLLSVGDPPGLELHILERLVLERKEALIVKDFEQTIDIRRTGASYIPPSRPPHPGIRSVMVLPIAYHDQVAGLIHLHASAPNRFDETARAIAETLAIQAATALTSALNDQEQLRKQEQLAALNTLLDETKRVLEHTQQAADQSQANSSLLYQKELEQVSLIQLLDRRVQRAQAGLDIAERINRQNNRQGVLTSLGRELMALMGMNIALVAESSPHGPRLIQTLGDLPGGVSLEALLGQRNPLHHSLQTGEKLLVASLPASPGWSGSPLLQALGASSFVCLPVRTAEGRDSAILATGKEPLPPFTPEDEQLFTQLLRLVSTRLQALSQLDETRQHLAEVNMLLDFNRQLGSLEPSRILQTLVESARRILPQAQASLVALWDGKQGLLLPQAVSGYPHPEALLEVRFPPGETLPGEVLRSGTALRLDEVDFARHYPLSSADLLRYRDATNGKLPVSSLLVPIKPTPAAVPLGVLILDNFDTPAAFTAEHQAMVSSLTQQTALYLENAALYAETRRFSDELEGRVQERTAELAREHQRAEILLRIITELSASLDLDQVLNRTMKVLNEIVDAEQITLLVHREGESRLHHLASVGYIPVPAVDKRATAFASDQGLAGWVISHSQPALIPNVLEDARWVQLPGPPSAHRSAIGVPLLIGAEAVGALLFFHRQVNHFSPDQLDLVQAAANQVAVAVNNAELYRLIRDQAEDLGLMLRDQQVEASRSRAILEAVADGVLVTDAQRAITLFNDSAERVLGLDRSQVIGKSLEHFTGLFGRAAQTWKETIRRWSEDPATHLSGEVYAEQITLEDGRVLSVHLTPVSLREQFLGTVSIFTDITHQVEVDRLKSEFVATVSHELRTPMTSIKGYVDILMMGAAGALSEQQSHFLEIVKNNTERLTVLVDDLLDISRIETGRVTLAMQPVDLREEAEKSRERLALRASKENKAMDIQVSIGQELPLVRGDVGRIAQILDNLLENAYHYTAEGGQITLTAHQAGEEVQVEVRDTGIGIPLEAQPRVFERFYRGDHPYVLATSGTGLGLAIVQHLVGMHSGRIWLESSGIPGEGSTFSFTLPVYIPEKQLAVARE